MLFRAKPKWFKPPQQATARHPTRRCAAAYLKRNTAWPDCRIAKTSIRQEQQAAFSALQPARANRDRLEGAHAAIFKQQQELQSKLEAIDAELRAIAAYEEARSRVIWPRFQAVIGRVVSPLTEASSCADPVSGAKHGERNIDLAQHARTALIYADIKKPSPSTHEDLPDQG